jgi:hypothetical protein
VWLLPTNISDFYLIRPGKSSAAVIGEFQLAAFLFPHEPHPMEKPGGLRLIIDPGIEYTYQFLVNGVKVADLIAKKIGSR